MTVARTEAEAPLLTRERRSPKQILEAILEETFIDERTGPYRLQLAPGLSEMELNLRELGLPAPPLPAVIRELLLFAEGFKLGATKIGFWCFELFALESMFPCGNLLGDPYGEGSGAFWVLDVSQRTGEWGPVFYVGHDPAEVVLQASGLAEFLEDLIEAHRSQRSILAAIDPFGTEVGRLEPCLQNAADWKDAADPALRAFAESLPPRKRGWQVADLRDRRLGTGFSWDRFGPETVVRRFGSELLFALSAPRKAPREGLFHGWFRSR